MVQSKGAFMNKDLLIVYILNRLKVPVLNKVV